MMTKIMNQIPIRNIIRFVRNEYLYKFSHSMSAKPIENSIIQKLTTQLKPAHLEVHNESYMHNVPKGSETHFKVVVVTDQFSNLPLIKRHRMINGILEEELKSGVHALSINAYTSQQWEASSQVVKPSPTCLGGFGK